MKASELIKELTDMIEKHGDQQVCYKDYGMGGYAMYVITSGIGNDSTCVDLDNLDEEEYEKKILELNLPTDRFKTFVLGGEMIYCN